MDEGKELEDQVNKKMQELQDKEQIVMHLYMTIWLYSYELQ